MSEINRTKSATRIDHQYCANRLHCKKTQLHSRVRSLAFVFTPWCVRLHFLLNALHSKRTHSRSHCVYTGFHMDSHNCLKAKIGKVTSQLLVAMATASATSSNAFHHLRYKIWWKVTNFGLIIFIHLWEIIGGWFLPSPLPSLNRVKEEFDFTRTTSNV